MPRIIFRPLDKLTVAERQLREAIRMLFSRRDPVSVHTLACAAAQVIADLLENEGRIGLLRNGGIIKEQHRKRVRDALARSENFFKHADRDPGGTLDFKPSQTHWMIFLALWEYKLLAKRDFVGGEVYLAWMFSRYPDLLLESELKRRIEGIATELGTSPNDYDLFLSAFEDRVGNG